MLTKERIKDAVNALGNLSVDYGDMSAEEVGQLDDAIDTVIMAAEAYEHLGADNYEREKKKLIADRFIEGYHQAREDVESLLVNQGILFQTTDNDFGDVDEITIASKNKKQFVFVPEIRGNWEAVERDNCRPFIPMRVCSECQRNNFYPGKYCTYCGSININEGE